MTSQDNPLSVKLVAYSAAALLSIRLHSLIMHLTVAMTVPLSLTGVCGLKVDGKHSDGLGQADALSPFHCSPGGFAWAHF